MSSSNLSHGLHFGFSTISLSGVWTELLVKAARCDLSPTLMPEFDCLWWTPSAPSDQCSRSMLPVVLVRVWRAGQHFAPRRTRAHTPQKCRQSLCAELNTRKRHRLSVNHIKLLTSATSEEFVLFPWSSVSQKNNSPTDRHKSLALGLRCFHEFKRSPKHWDLQRWYLKPDSDLGRLDSFRLKQLETLIKCFSFSYFHPPSFHSGSIVLQCSYSWNALSALKRKQTETVTKKTTSIVLVKSRPKSSHEKVVFKEKQRI